MEVFRAGTQYGDGKGTVAADDSDSVSFRDYLESKGLDKPAEFLVAVSLAAVDNQTDKIGLVLVRAYFFDGPKGVADVAKAISKIKGPIPVRVVKVPMTLPEFICVFKHFDVMLISRELQTTIEGKEYSVVED